MTLGSKIKKARTEANLTQKDLAEQLSVTFQTVSKWEGGVTEPDLATLRSLAKILGVSLEYLVSEEDEAPEAKLAEDSKPMVSVPVPQKRQIGTCPDCRSPIMEGDFFHNVERRSPSGVKETVMVCDACFKRHEEEIERRAKEVERSTASIPVEKKGGIAAKISGGDEKKIIVWGVVVGVIALIATLIACIVNYAVVGIGWTIAAPLLIGYAATATVYCIFTESYISDVFLEVAGWSIHFPGLIFSWDLDGLMWLIAMKILFFVLGIFAGIGMFLLALALAALLSMFSFVPLLIYNRSHK